MKYFDKDGKYNFVDSNNVLVGYNSGQCCCENADWFISKKEETKTSITEYESEFTDYIFDTTYFQDVNSPDVYDGGMVRFKLISEGKPDLFLHLYNSHNGYYGHGFTATIGGLKWESGCL